MTPTFFRECDYRESGCGAAIERLVDDFGFRYPGIETVEHVYFYAVAAVDDATRRGYLEQAYRLGREFESSSVDTRRAQAEAPADSVRAVSVGGATSARA
jgi:NAD(P)H dehydrogenase (quinone)